MNLCKIYILLDSRQPTKVKYVGSTCVELEKRLQEHKKDCFYKKRCNNKRAAWVREVFDFVQIKQIEECDCNNRMSREIYWIKYFLDNNEDLVNSTLYNENHYSEETRYKMRIAHLGKTRSEKHKKAISEALKKRPKNTKTFSKISKALKGRKLSPEHYEKCKVVNIGRISPKRISIEQYDLNQNFIRTWSSITQCAKELNLQRSNIIAQIKGRRNKVGDFIFKYSSLV